MPEPSAALAVIVALPGATAVITPALTVTAFAFEVVQLSFLLDALFGETVAVNVLLSPAVIVSLLAESLIPVTGCLTTTLHLAYFALPSIAFAVI